MVITTSAHLADKSVDNIKFLCSYGGKIIPRFPDAKLRYHGGHTRVLSLNRHTSFSELLLKMAELCDSSVNLRCQLPNEDLDALVTIKSDEDLVNLIEEYDQIAPSSMKIRAFLTPLKTSTSKTPSPPSSEYATSSLSPKSFSPPSSFSVAGCSPRFLPASMPVSYGKRSPVVGRNVPQPKSHYGCLHCHRNPSLVHNGNHWQ